MSRFIPLAIFVCLGALAACGPDPVAAIAALEGDAVSGETLFSANCASCHGADLTGTALGPSLISELGEDPEELMEYVVFGEDDMPAFGDLLEDQEIADIVAFLKGFEPG